MDWFMHHAVLARPRLRGRGGGLRAVPDGWLLKQPGGQRAHARDRARRSRKAHRRTCSRQYTTIAIVAIVPFLLLGVYDKLGWGTAFGFLIGAVLSAAAGFIGMNVAVRSNVAHGRGGARRARAGAQRRVPRRLGHRPARRRARAARRRRLLLVPHRRAQPHADHGDPRPRRARLRRLADLGLRPARRRHLHEGRRRRRRPGREDRGGHPRGRPAQPGRDRRQRRRQRRRLRRHGRRPVRDLRRHRGRRDAARHRRRARATPSSTCTRSRSAASRSIASVIGTFFARLGSGENAVINALYKAVLVGDASSRRSASSRSRWRSTSAPRTSFWHLYLSAHRRPRRHVPARGDHRVLHGHPLEPGQEDREGLADRATRRTSSRASPSACRRPPLPVIVIAAGILVAHHFAGLYGIGVAVMAQLSMTGLIVALDAFGPVTDNAGGIAEMADLPEAVRGDHRPARRGRQHDEGGHEGLRDRLGRARRARPVRLVHARAHQQARGHAPRARSLRPRRTRGSIAGLFIGGLMPFLFASLAMQAVGRVGGEVVEEVRRQFREHPGIMEGTERPEYGRAIDIVTGSAIKSMLLPALIPIVLPDRGRDHQRPRCSAACSSARS